MPFKNLIHIPFTNNRFPSKNVQSPFISKFLEATRRVHLSDHLPVGSISPDRGAIVGKKDWVFIFEGSNQYMAQYAPAPSARTRQKALEWQTTINNRKRKVRETGASFFQLIIPNKLSIYPKSSPRRLQRTLTPILRRLLRLKPGGLICPLRHFRGQSRSGDIFRRNDSHLNFFGLFHLYRFVCEMLSLEMDPALFDMKLVQTLQAGDLGVKFQPILHESLFAPDHDAFSERLNARLDWQLDNSRKILAAGKHNGIHVKTVCPSAKNPVHLLVFGNSFLDHPFSWGFSPFLAQSVKTYDFVWSPHVDMALTQELKPDIVLAQTCERFLPKPPKDIA